MSVAARRVTLSANGAVFDLPWLVADELGYFEQEGVDLARVRRIAEDPNRDPFALNDLVRSKEEDFTLFNPINGTKEQLFEQEGAEVYNACEWGVIKRVHEGKRGGRIVALRPAVTAMAIVVRPDSNITHPEDLRGQSVAVAFHTGSHYITLKQLEGFLPREEIKLVMGGAPSNRLKLVLDGEVAGATLMEPYISLAEKLGLRIVSEAYYRGGDIGDPNLDGETLAKINRALTRAVDTINADPDRYVHYLLDDLDPASGTLSPSEFRTSRLRYVAPKAYPEHEFRAQYNWMVSWGLIPEDDSYERIVSNSLALAN